MATVKGSKQQKMVVVPHRPMHKVLIYIAFFAVLLVCSVFTYQVGQERGMRLGSELQTERDRLYASLETAEQQVERMHQQIAELELGGVIDNRANEEVRQTIEALQDQIAEQNEEISFYKGVMLPNVAEKGLRIERLQKPGGKPMMAGDFLNGMPSQPGMTVDTAPSAQGTA